MYCYNCGKQVPDDSTFCAFCGSGLSGNAAEGETAAREGQKADMKNKAPHRTTRKRAVIIGAAVFLLALAALIVFVVLPALGGKGVLAGILPIQTADAGDTAPNDEIFAETDEPEAAATPAPLASEIPVTAPPAPPTPTLPAPAAPAIALPAPPTPPPPTPTPLITPEPTPTPTPAPRYFSDAGLENFLLEGSGRYYDYSEIVLLNAYELSIVRNGLYAMSGLQFVSNRTLIDYFYQRSWYYPDTTSAETAKSRFNQYQNVNLELITDVEREKGLR